MCSLVGCWIVVCFAIARDSSFDNASDAISANNQISFYIWVAICEFESSLLSLSARDFEHIGMHNCLVWYSFPETLPEILTTDHYSIHWWWAMVDGRKMSKSVAIRISHAEMGA